MFGGSIPSQFNAWDKLNYKITLTCFLIAFTTLGFGNHLFGVVLPTDVSTFLICIIFIIQLLSNSLQFSRLLLFTWLYIFFQTFILNWLYIDFQSSFKHFIGLVLFSVVSFSFLSRNRDKLNSIIQIYYKFCFYLVCLAIIQLFFFVAFDFSFLPQNIIAGSLVFGGSNSFVPEVFGIFPRAVGLSTEPASYVAILLPAVYIALNILIGNGKLFGVYNKTIAFIILLGFIISFSIVGYFGLVLCLVSIFRKRLKTNFFRSSLIILIFIGLGVFLLASPLGGKIYSFINVSQDITGADYTGNDATSFALLSNLMVAIKGLEISHFMGTGLNTHVITYDATINAIFLDSQILLELNKENAGALFIRIPSEFGLPGLIAFIWFLIHFKVKSDNIKTPFGAINSLCLTFLIMYSSRTGHYLSVLFMFFLAMYYYTYVLSKKQLS